MVDSYITEATEWLRLKIDSRVTAAMFDIIALSQPYKVYGKSFTFESIKSLDNEVNSILVKISDDIVSDIIDCAESGVAEEEDKEAAIAFATGRFDERTLQEMVDMQMTHLKNMTEGWLAIGFANDMSVSDICTQAKVWIKNPYISEHWKKAFKDGGYESDIIAQGGYHYGSGNIISPIDGTAALAAYILMSAYQFGEVAAIRRQGAIGYTVHRGSNYDCGTCDALCGYTHPINEVVLPAHPHCMCYIEPVYE